MTPAVTSISANVSAAKPAESETHLSVATKEPLKPSQSLTPLSKEAVASHLPSGENLTCMGAV